MVVLSQWGIFQLTFLLQTLTVCSQGKSVCKKYELILPHFHLFLSLILLGFPTNTWLVAIFSGFCDLGIWTATRVEQIHFCHTYNLESHSRKVFCTMSSPFLLPIVFHELSQLTLPIQIGECSRRETPCLNSHYRLVKSWWPPWLVTEQRCPLA